MESNTAERLLRRFLQKSASLAHRIAMNYFVYDLLTKGIATT